MFDKASQLLNPVPTQLFPNQLLLVARSQNAFQKQLLPLFLSFSSKY